MDLTAGDAVAQPGIDLAEQLLVDGPDEQRAQLDGVDNEPRGDEHVAEDQVAQKLGLQQPDEVHDARILKRGESQKGERSGGSGKCLKHTNAIH